MVRARETRPLIGVTTSEMRTAAEVMQIPQGEPARREMALGLEYLEAVEAGGGVPVAIPLVQPDTARALLERLSGLCLSGGPDLHPDAYEAAAHSDLGPTWPDIDRFELSLVREADAMGLPILAICRGAQVLNIARRGTLFQHVPERFGTDLQHRLPEYGPTPAHPVDIQPGSTLANALGCESVEVNSFHHQAADTVGRGLRAVAWSPDGVIEAVEAPQRDFVVGVQWHAEAMTDSPQQASLFRAFIQAARHHEAQRAGRALAAA